MKTETTNQQASLKHSARAARGKRSGVQVIAGAVFCVVALCGALSIMAQAQQKASISFQPVNVPGAAATQAYGINNKNLIVGDYINAAGAQLGMDLKGSKVTSYSCPDGAQTVLLGVNSGKIGVADCAGADPLREPGPDGQIYLAFDGHLNQLSKVCICNNPEGVAINDPEILMVLFQDENGNPQIGTFGVNSGVFTQLSPPEQVYEPVPNPWYPLGINNSGALVLETVNPASGLIDSWFYSGGTYTEINVPGALSSYAHGINNNGDIVYTFLDANLRSHGALYLASTGQFYEFDDPNGPGVTEAFGINDEVAGKKSSKLRIVGDYSLPGALNQAFEATVTIKP
jgi:hypothetical protein